MGNACASENSVKTANSNNRPTEKPAASQQTQKSTGNKAKNGGAANEKKQTAAGKPKNLELYVFPGSAVCRAVMMTCAAAGIDYKEKCINVFKGEHKTEEFKKISPECTLPTINDDGYVMTESRAIMIYLLNKYAPNSPLYPSDLQKRAVVEKWLNYDCGDFAPAVMKHAAPILRETGECNNEEAKKVIGPMLEYINKCLSSGGYLAGDCLTIADFSVFCTLTILWLVGVDISKYEHIKAWEKNKLMCLPYFKDVHKGLMEWKKMIDAKKSGPAKPEDVELYVAGISGPCRAVMMAAKHAGIPYKHCELNMMEGEHKKEEFKAINPRSKIPTLRENGFILEESRAIMKYLVSKYAPESGLYPSDPKQRALVDRWLNWEMGTCAPAVSEYVFPFVMKKEPLSDEKKKKVCEVADFLNSHLATNKFLVGDCITIADLSAIGTLSYLYMIGFGLPEWEHIKAWFGRIKEQPYFEETHKGLMAMKEQLAAREGGELKVDTTGCVGEVKHLPATDGVAVTPAKGLKLCWNSLSPFARAAYHAMKMSGVDFELKEIDVFNGEHKKPEYLALNPAGQVPTLIDGDFVLTESRAIMTYVLNKYKPDCTLYPQDLQQRAMVDKWLCYEQETFATAWLAHVVPLLFGDGTLDPAKEQKLKDVLTFVDECLTASYICGDSCTLADISLFGSLSQLLATEYDITAYKNVCAWKARMKECASKFEELVNGFKRVNGLYKKNCAQRGEKTQQTSEGLTLYMDMISPNARPVFIAFKEAGLDFKVHPVNLQKGEHKQPEYLAINPQGQVPAISDGDFNMSDSRPIMMYAINKYAPDCPLYPSDLQKRAEVEKWMNYDTSTFYSKCVNYVFPKLFKGEEPEPSVSEGIVETMTYVDKELENRPFVCGDVMTLPDITMHAILSQLLVTDYDISAFKNVCAWRDRMDKVVNKYEEIPKAMAGLKQFYQSKKKSDGLTLYVDFISPNARPVFIAFKEAGLDFKVHPVSLLKGEQKQPEYLAINPEGQVPAISDGDFKMSDSRPIMMYAISKYAPDCPLYPSDLQKRAEVEKWMNYDTSTFYSKCVSYVYPKLFKGEEPEPSVSEGIVETMTYVDKELENRPFVCGDAMTLPDITMHAMLSQLLVTDYDISAFKNVCAWRDRMDAVVNKYEEIPKAMDGLKQFYQSKSS